MRGVNKLVLEVKPESEYFEKALLFLNPDKISESQKDISGNAEKILNVLSDSKYYEKSDKLRTFLLISISAASGSFISLLTLFIFGMIP